MTHDEEPADPVMDLEQAARTAVEPWLVRCVTDTARRALGHVTPELEMDARAMAADAAPRVLAVLHELLQTDVDQQRTNPLSVLRDAVRYPTAVLASAGVPRPFRDEFAARAFPDDVYDLAPATWRDVDPSLHEPGIVWGAWKAATVLRRRREEGRR